jgi:hypothetical protein
MEERSAGCMEFKEVQEENPIKLKNSNDKRQSHEK